MNKLVMVSLACAAAVLAACGSVAVNHDFDPAYDFAAVRTYNYMAPSGESVITPRRLEQIRASTSKVLAEKGYTMSDTPQVLIDIRGASYYDSAAYTVDTKEFETKEWGVRKSQVVYNIVDTRTNALVWQGIADSPTSSNLTAGQMEMKVDEMTRKLFAEFPPKRKK